MRNKPGKLYRYTLTNYEDIAAISWSLNYWVFRGQANADWALETRVERVARRFDMRSPEDLEWLSLDKFMRSSHQYMSAFPTRADRLDWLSIVQHYGGPTRLLDFTRSFYVALFFALEEADGQSAVWAINPGTLFDNLERKGIPVGESGVEDFTRANDIVNARRRHDKRPSGVLPVMPRWMSDRQSLQQGLFLYPENLHWNHGFTENLAAEFDLDGNALDRLEEIDDVNVMAEFGNSRGRLLIKIALPGDVAARSEIMQHLAKVNINARTLFPGLDGLARSANFSTEWYDAVPRILKHDFQPRLDSPPN